MLLWDSKTRGGGPETRGGSPGPDNNVNKRSKCFGILDKIIDCKVRLDLDRLYICDKHPGA